MTATARDWIWVSPKPPGQHTREILEYVCAKNNVPIKAMTAQARKREWAWPRQEAMYRVWKERTSLSLPSIGRIFGGRDHTTVLHGIRAYCEREGLSYHDEKARCGR